MLRALPFALAAAAALVAGCGGSSGDSLFSSGGGATASGGATVGTGGSSSSGGAGGGGAPSGGAGAGTASGGASATGGASTSTSGGATASGGASATGGAGGFATLDGGRVLVDGGPPDVPTPNSIYCGGSPCTILAAPGGVPYECCIPNPPFPTSCYPTVTGCVTGGTPLFCDDAADCPNGQLCCGTLTAQSSGATCAKDCTGASFQLCRSSKECHGKACRPLAANPDYSICQ